MFMQAIRAACALICAATASSWAQHPLPAPNLDLLRAGDVRAIAVQADGKLVVGGLFERIDGNTSHRQLARLLANGAHDATFTLDANGPVRRLRRDSGFIYLCGSFTAIGGVARPGLARIVESTGSLDAAWNPAIGAGPAVVDIAFDGTGGAFVLTETSSDLQVAGTVRKLDAAGVVVGSWAPAFSPSIGPTAITVAAGSLYVAGSLMTPTATQNTRIFRVNPASGAVDGGFTANLTTVDMRVTGMSGDGASALFAWGSMNVNTVGDQIIWTAPSSLTKISLANGQVAAGWSSSYQGADYEVSHGPSGLFSLRDSSSSLGFAVQLVKISSTDGSAVGGFTTTDLTPSFALVQSGASVFAGGAFAYVNGQRRSSIAKLDAATGTLQPGFDPRIRSTGFVYALAAGANGKSYAGGEFISVNGMDVDNILRLNADGTLDAAWTRGVQGFVANLLEAGGFLYAAGTFQVVDGAAHPFVVRFNTATQARDASWVPNPNDSLRDLAGDGTAIYLAGSFDQMGGQPRPCVAKVNLTTGALDTSWAPPVAGQFGSTFLCANRIQLIAPYLYVGTNSGRITVNGAERRLGRVNLTNGAADPAFDPNPSRAVRAMTYDGQHLYVGIDANSASFGAVATGIAKIDPATGSVDSTFLATFPFSLLSGLARSSGALYAVGYMQSGSNVSTKVTRYLPTGATDSSWNLESTPSIGNVPRIVATPRGVLVGSDFTVIAGASRTALAAFSTDLRGSPGSLAFGGQSMGTTSAPMQVLLTNLGSSALSVSGLSVPTGFSATHACDSIPAGASCPVTVRFAPPVFAGAVNSTVGMGGTLVINSNSSGGAQHVSLSGTAEKSLVSHYYQATLRRAPDSGGKLFWQNEATRLAGLGANVNETWYSMATFFFFSSEYAAFNRDNTGFVTDLYKTFFNRDPDGGGLAFWVGQLNQGMPREVVLVSFMLSTEFTTFTQAIFGNQQVRAEIDVVMDFYRGLLSRLPDNGGFANWVNGFRAAQCQGGQAVYSMVEQISSDFATSGEYLGRGRTNAQYVGDLYNAFLRRGGDLSGVQHWINQLNSNAQTREQVRQAFISTPEFNGRANAIINQGCIN